MKIRILLYIIILLAPYDAYNAEENNILIVNSYHKGLQWTDEIVDGICLGLGNYANNSEIFIEYLDAKRFFDSTYYRQIFKLFHKKYHNRDIEVIISSDDNALEFLLTYRDSLFEDVPVIFSGINCLHIYPEGYTGVLEKIDFIENIQLIERLHPEYSKIYFLTDFTKTGNIIYERANKALKPHKNKYRYEFVRDYSFDELHEKIANLDEDAVVLLTAFTTDKHGKYYSYDDLVRTITDVASVPVYGVWTFYLNHGVVGGKMNSGKEQGLMAGKMAKRIIDGENVNQINVEIAPTEYHFDYKYLTRFNINQSNMPEGAEIINQPFDFLKENKQQTIYTAVIFLLLVFVIVLLWVNIIFKRNKLRQERRYLKKIEISNEKLMYAKEKAEEANRLKTAFLTNMSHELRTPMNGIIGFSKLLKDNPELSAETNRKYLNIINKSGYILLNLINDIIDLSKIESSHLKINYRPCKLNDIMDELLSIYRNEKEGLEKYHIELKLEKGVDNDNFSIYSDPNRIRQILYNLLSNALKFTCKGKITFGYKVTENDIIFYVKDTGIGLTISEKEIIFERFRQVDDKTTRRYGGSGLGLSISKGIVENMNGKIWVESEKENIAENKPGGSTFYFSIPLQVVKTNKKQNQKKESNFIWPGKTILIVEDAIISYELLTKFLKDSQVSFIHAENGEQAVELCRNKHHIDLVLMDIQLPMMDGLEATNLIKKDNPKLPVIAQTANAMEDDRKNIIDAGCDDYIAKPINKYDLLEKLDNLLKTN
ncbi:MAG: response regulator [Bacteroidales bacterium]